MKIQVEVEIFDDPEFCGMADEIPCPELYRIEWIFYCHRYVKHGNKDDFIIEEDRNIGKTNKLPLKCDQCKAAYQKAKQ